MGCSSAKEVDESEFLVRVQNDGFHDQYRLGPCLGQGAFGTVYIAECRESSEEWAVKVLALKSAQEQSSNRRKRTLRRKALDEKDVWHALGKHPNIVSLREWYMDTDFMYLVMRCCTPLVHRLLKEPELNEHTYADYFKDMAAALAHIHSRRVIHRDVKHDNFLVSGDANRTVKLCDFGLSVMLEQNCPCRRFDKCGSAPYMSPEMVTEHAAHGTSSDVWSLGVVVYTLLFGTWPYQGRTAPEIKKSIRKGAVPPLFRPPMGYELNAVSNVAICFVRVLLIRDPHQRPSALDCLKMDYLRNKNVNANAELRDPEKISLSQILVRAVKACRLSAPDRKSEANASETLMEMQAMAQLKFAGRVERQTETADTPTECQKAKEMGGGAEGRDGVILVNI